MAVPGAVRKGSAWREQTHADPGTHGTWFHNLQNILLGVFPVVSYLFPTAERLLGMAEPPELALAGCCWVPCLPPLVGMLYSPVLYHQCFSLPSC